MADQVKYALYVRLVPKQGKNKEVEEFLKSALPLVQQEPGTERWFALREDDNAYSIFDTFNDEAARDAHLNGEVAKALGAKASELFAEPPQINKVDVLAQK